MKDSFSWYSRRKVRKRTIATASFSTLSPNTRLFCFVYFAIFCFFRRSFRRRRRRSRRRHGIDAVVMMDVVLIVVIGGGGLVVVVVV